MSQFLPTKYKTLTELMNIPMDVSNPEARMEIKALFKYTGMESISMDVNGEKSFTDFLKYQDSLISGDFVIANQLVPKLAIYGGAGLILLLILKK